MTKQIAYKDSISLLNSQKIPVCRQILARNKSELSKLSNLSFPLAMKVISQEIVHKSDLGLVAVNIKSKEDAHRIYSKFMKIISENAKDSKIDGVLFQEMVQGTELIVGVKKDATFGHVIMFGLGGIFVEVFKDVSFRVCPVSSEHAKKMIEEVKGYAILKGIRGQKPVNVNALSKIIVSLSNIVSKHPEIEEIDLNPVIANENGAYIVDVRIMTHEGNLSKN